MDGCKAATIDLERLPRIPRVGTRSLSTGWACLLGLGWPVVYALCLVLEPRPDGPSAAQLGGLAALLAELGSLAIFAGLVATGVSAASRSPRARSWALMTGGVLGVMAVACPASGHHAIGGWWVGQMALVGGMLALTVASHLRRD